MVKIGRTHLEDATPITVGQEWSGYVAMIDDARAALVADSTTLLRLAAGGTAVGTGLNSSPGFAEDIAAKIASLDISTVRHGPEQVRRSGIARPARAVLRRTSEPLRLTIQDRQ